MNAAVPRKHLKGLGVLGLRGENVAAALLSTSILLEDGAIIGESSEVIQPRFREPNAVVVVPN